MFKKNGLKAVYVLLSIVFISGCAGIGVLSTTSPPSIIVVEKIPSIQQPEWTKSTKDYWVDKGNVYSAGCAEKSLTLESSLSDAENKAREKLYKNVKSMILSEFKRSVEAQNYDVQTKVTINTKLINIVDAMFISGANRKETYSEKMKETFKKNETIYFNSYVLVELTSSDYMKNIRQAFSNFKNEYKSDKKVKKLIDTIDKSIKNGLK